MRHPDSWIPLRTTLGINIVDLHRKVAHGLDKIQRTLHKASLSTSTANTSRRGCRTELGINHCWMWNWWCLNSQAFFTECDLYYPIMYQHQHISVWTRTNLSSTPIQHRPQCLGASSEVNLRISMTILQTIFIPIGSDTDRQGTRIKQVISIGGREILTVL